jgi:glycerophosphoryl diester phosphodiesterase
MLVIGHRGIRAGGDIPENSRSAVLEAYRQGADGVEFDVGLASNGLIVFHDDNTARTASEAFSISEKSVAELQSLKLINEITGRPTTESPPDLADIFETVLAIQRNHRNDLRAQNFKLNIELKPITEETHKRRLEEPGTEIAHLQKELVDLVSNVMKQYVKKGLKLENFMISSFDMDLLRKVRQSDLDVHRRMLICSPTNPDPRKWREHVDEQGVRQMQYRIDTSQDENAWANDAKFDPAFDTFFRAGERKWQATADEILHHIATHNDDIRAKSVALPISSITSTLIDQIKQIDAGLQIAVWTTDEVKPVDPERTKQLCKTLIRRGISTFITDFPHLIAQAVSAISVVA